VLVFKGLGNPLQQFILSKCGKEWQFLVKHNDKRIVGFLFSWLGYLI